MARRIAQAVIRPVLRIGGVRRLVAAELGVSPKSGSKAAAAVPPVLPATFTDRHGTAHPLDPGWRDRLKPAWRVMLDPETARRPPDDEWLTGRARKSADMIAEVGRVLAMTAGARIEGRILEFGCYDGSAAQAFAALPGTSVTASDLSRYYVVQRPGEPTAGELAAEAGRLATLRARSAAAGGHPPDAVTFVEDDITTSTLPAGSFDLIASFEVLEHVRDPAETFASIARLLRPGGLTYHDYNPFFSQNGGHSLLTLDFPWGHARLDDDDLQRYLREVRPAEAEQASRFGRESLNRMTQGDLREAIASAGLELLSFRPWPERKLLRAVTPAMLSELQRAYPRATLDDLLATYVTVVARRPTHETP